METKQTIERRIRPIRCKGIQAGDEINVSGQWWKVDRLVTSGETVIIKTRIDGVMVPEQKTPEFGPYGIAVLAHRGSKHAVMTFSRASLISIIRERRLS